MESSAAASPLHQRILASAEAVDQRIGEMAADLIRRYAGQKPLFVCLLRGGAPFASRLMFALATQTPDFHPELDYMTVRTYGDERTARGAELVMGLSPSTKVDGRPVIILDDVLDEGYTATFTTAYIAEKGATSCELVVLVQKDRERAHFPNAGLYGFEAPASWLTGMGMDDARLGKEANRWLSIIAIANGVDELE